MPPTGASFVEGAVTITIVVVTAPSTKEAPVGGIQVAAEAT